MTLDEAIVHAKEQTEVFGGTHKEFLENVLEWLEELKEARKGFEENRKAGYKHGFVDGYNKAIDKFVDNLYQDYIYDSICRDDISFYGFGNKIKSIADQMKEGE